MLKCLFFVEEELKRLNEEVGGSYGAVNFNYDHSQPAEQEVQAPKDGNIPKSQRLKVQDLGQSVFLCSASTCHTRRKIVNEMAHRYQGSALIGA